MNQSSVPQQDEEAESLTCPYCGENYGPGELKRHTEPIHCGPCITCVDKPECYACRLMYCVCEVHRYRG